MRVYTYRAALWCEDCIAHIKRTLPKPAHVDEENESSYDSDDWPKGPYEADGIEADYADHCAGCGVFLENRLTDDGVKHLADQIMTGRVQPAVVAYYRDDYPQIWVAEDRRKALDALGEVDFDDLCARLHAVDKYDLGVSPR